MKCDIIHPLFPPSLPLLPQIAVCKANSAGPAFAQLVKQDLVLGDGQVLYP